MAGAGCWATGAASGVDAGWGAGAAATGAARFVQLVDRINIAIEAIATFFLSFIKHPLRITPPVITGNHLLA